MIQQITFKADKDLKDKAMKKAKAKGITLKTILVLSLQAFVDGKIDLGIQTTREKDVEELTFEDQGIMEKSAQIAKLLK